MTGITFWFLIRFEALWRASPPASTQRDSFIFVQHINIVAPPRVARCAAKCTNTHNKHNVRHFNISRASILLSLIDCQLLLHLGKPDRWRTRLLPAVECTRVACARAWHSCGHQAGALHSLLLRGQACSRRLRGAGHSRLQRGGMSGLVRGEL